MASKKKAVASLDKGLKIAVINRKFVVDYASLDKSDWEWNTVFEYFELHFDSPMPTDDVVFHQLAVRKT